MREGTAWCTSCSRYTLQVGDTFIKFKRILQFLPLDNMICLSSDRIVLNLSLAVQYSYTKDDIMPVVLRQFGGEDEYLSYVVDTVKGSIVSTCGNFTAEDYYLGNPQLLPPSP